MPGLAPANTLIVWLRIVPSSLTRDHRLHRGLLQLDGFQTPETPAAEGGNLPFYAFFFNHLETLLAFFPRVNSSSVAGWLLWITSRQDRKGRKGIRLRHAGLRRGGGQECPPSVFILCAL